jgi:hypothetical protein
MDNLINTYTDEWSEVVKGKLFFTSVGGIVYKADRHSLRDPVKRKQFKQFVNTDERRQQAEIITERGQQRPADWPKAYPGVKLTEDQFSTAKAEWKWTKVATRGDMGLTEAGTTSVAVKYGDTQLAVYHVPRRGYYATQQMWVLSPRGRT